MPVFNRRDFLLHALAAGTVAPAIFSSASSFAQYGAEKIEYWSWSAAGAIGILAPIVLFIALMQRHLVKGLTFGTVKG